jgi:peptidoglycan LD-endopeptidase LytH
MTRVARTPRATVWPVASIVVAFFAGVAVDGWLRTHGPPIPESVRLKAETPAESASAGIRAKPVAVPAIGPNPAAPAAGRTAPTTGALPTGTLRVPIDGTDVRSWKGEFDQRRDAGRRGHEAVDILSPRNTPVHAVSAGTIAKIFESKAGGHTIYQFDAAGRLCYYYAHLQRYADGLHEGQAVGQGDVIGYVGTSGNAPANAPHLHFAVFRLDDAKRWWTGTPIDPYVVFTRGLGG